LISREIFGISKPFPNTKTILMLISNKIVSKRIQIILMDRVSIKLNFSMSVSTSENVKYPFNFHLVGQKGLSFDLRVLKEGKIFSTFILLV